MLKVVFWHGMGVAFVQSMQQVTVPCHVIFLIAMRFGVWDFIFQLLLVRCLIVFVFDWSSIFSHSLASE